MILMVDWLGRGGIAQCTEAWALGLAERGADVAIVTRPGRELSGRSVPVIEGPTARGAAAEHIALVRTAARAIRDLRPSVVVVSNYLFPSAERLVTSAASRSGAKVVFVVHNARPHSGRSGTALGLHRMLQRADVVVAMSEFVADQVAVDRRDAVELVPHPVPVGMLDRLDDGRMLVEKPDEALALHFGVVKRSYKGTRTMLDLAAHGVDGWRLAIVGNGAPERARGVLTVPGFAAANDLALTVKRSDATLLPYRSASQSGAVVLSQALGTLPVASAVGGIPEQIEHGVTGILVRAGADVGEWRSALAGLRDGDVRDALGAQAREQVWASHARSCALLWDFVA